MIRPAVLILLLSVAFIANSQEYKSMESRYMLYSGSIGDPIAPTKGNAKVSLEVTGKAAEDLFNQIGPDVKDTCVAENEGRFRSKGNGSISCQYTKQDGYVCYFGVDLKKGKLISASVC
jgi:hypothetical protein